MTDRKEQNRKYYEKKKLEDPDYYRNKIKRWREENPEKFLESKNKYENSLPVETRRRWHRNSARVYRERHHGKWRKYQDKYMKEYYKDPINHRAHLYRNKANVLAGNTFPLRVYNRKHKWSLETAQFVWRLYNSKCAGECVNHIISIPHFLRFNLEAPLDAIFNPINLEVIDKVKNSEKYNFISEKQIKIAEILESQYEELKGFTDFIKENKND